MSKDKLDTLLEAYDKQRGSGEFSTVSDFKAKFFEAVEKLPEKTQKKHISGLWITGIVFAAAAALLMVVIPTFVIEWDSNKNIENTMKYTQALVEKLKNIFPERSVGLCVINDELETFELDEERPRNILINYSIQRINDGKEMKLHIASSNNNNAEIDTRQAQGTVWVFEADRKIVNVDTDLALKLDQNTTIRIQKSNLLKIGEKQFVSEFEYNGRKYQLLQSACRI